MQGLYKRDIEVTRDGRVPDKTESIDEFSKDYGGIKFYRNPIILLKTTDRFQFNMHSKNIHLHTTFRNVDQNKFKIELNIKYYIIFKILSISRFMIRANLKHY